MPHPALQQLIEQVNGFAAEFKCDYGHAIQEVMAADPECLIGDGTDINEIEAQLLSHFEAL